MANKLELPSKNFWERKEGTVGMVVLIAAAVGAYVFLAPFILSLLTTTLGIVAVGAALFSVGYVAFDRRFRALIGYMYKSAMRRLTGMFVEVDPLGIIESYLEDQEAAHRKMAEQIERLSGSRQKLSRKVAEYKSEMEHCLQKATAAKKQAQESADTLFQSRMASQVTLNSRQAERLRGTVMTLTAMQGKMDILNRGLEKMFYNSGVFIEDTRNEVELKKQEREMILAGHKALTSAMKVFRGDEDKKAMYDQALEFMEADVANKVGQMEQWLRQTDDVMNSIDLDNEVDLQKGLVMLEEWEKSTDINNILTGARTPAALPSNASASQVINSAVQAPATASKYLK